MTELTHLTKTPYLTLIYRYKTSEFSYVIKISDKYHLNLYNIISKSNQSYSDYRKISKKTK